MDRFTQQESQGQLVCPKTGKPIASPHMRPWLVWLFPLAGIVSLIWFLVRVLPKPSRALYPCQRVAAPLASSFVIWILGLGGCALAFRKARQRLFTARYVLSGVLLAIGVTAAIVAAVGGPSGIAGAIVEESILYQSREAPNAPVGVAKGIHPGRVAWVYDPTSTKGDVAWDNSTGYFWDANHSEQSVVNDMVGKSICWLAGESTETSAWDAIFHYYNRNHNKGDIGYQPGEKIAVKINLSSSIDWSSHLIKSYLNGNADQNYQMIDPNNPADLAMYQYQSNEADNSPQVIIGLLHQLVDVAGIPQEDIYLGDPIRYFLDKLWIPCHAAYPNVHYVDCLGKAGRELATYTGPSALFYSNNQLEVIDAGTPIPNQAMSDQVADFIYNSDYFINLSDFKREGSFGVTISGKNNFGSMNRSPAHLHDGLHGPAGWETGWGVYNVLVDHLGNKNLGGKTLLYLCDGLYGGWWASGSWSMPEKWHSLPYNGQPWWPSSVFASLDPIALDSVCLDFILGETPQVGDCADNYMVEAAKADNPPSGTFYAPNGDGVRLQSLGTHEHWNNATDKKYSRNLGTGDGIELVSSAPIIPVSGVSLTANPAAPRVVNTQITLTAHPTGGINPEFRFKAGYQDAGGWHWTALQAYSAANTCTWTPTSAHLYTLVAVTHEPGSLTEFSGTLSYRVNATPLTAVGLQANPVSPQIVGTPITLTATPTGGTNVEYKFRAGYQDASGWHWSDLQGYNTTATCPWTPATAHLYTLTVYAREVGHTTSYDQMQTLSFRVNAQPLTAVDLSALPASPQAVNTPITLTATKTGGSNVEYKFRAGYQDASGWHWADLGAYQSATTCVWTPTAPNLYSLVVWAREAGSTVNYTVTKAISYRIQPLKLTAVRLDITPAAPQAVNTPLTLTATPTGGTNVEYKFRAGYQDAAGWHWADLTGYSTTRSYNWTPTGAHSYSVVVWAREVGSTVNYLVYTTTTYRVTN